MIYGGFKRKIKCLNCKKYFISTHGKKKFCSKSCQFKNWCKSPVNAESRRLSKIKYYKSEKCKNTLARYKEKFGEHISNKTKIQRFEIKKQVIKHYSKGTNKCNCCGESMIEFLTIDHIHNNGNEERRRLKIAQGASFYRWLINNKFPKGYQILCMNCNWAKGRNNGICPHKKRREDMFIWI